MTDLIGWAGSALLVASLLQERVLRFRWLNLAASVILVGFNALVAVWPMAGLNVVIAAINTWHLVRLVRRRHDHRHYEVVTMGADEPYLRLLLERHRHDIERYNPGALAPSGPSGIGGEPAGPGTDLLAGLEVRPGDLDAREEAGLGPDVPGADRLAFLVLSGGESVGVVLAHRTGPASAQVDLDYVLPRYRDFTPGEFVYRRDGPFARAGVWQVTAPRRMRDSDAYLASLGFRPVGGDRVLDLV